MSLIFLTTSIDSPFRAARGKCNAAYRCFDAQDEFLPDNSDDGEPPSSTGTAFLAILGVRSELQLTRKIVFSSLAVFVVLLLFVSLNNLVMINL